MCDGDAKILTLEEDGANWVGGGGGWGEGSIPRGPGDEKGRGSPRRAGRVAPVPRP
jgi:hypothetical protein